jgi:indolepyruvate ferredoxin oxidoreductase beta subunit
VEEVIGKMEELVGKVEVVETTGEGEVPLAANVLMMGALAGSGLVPITIGSFEEAMREILAPKDLELNLQAFRKGVEAIGKG